MAGVTNRESNQQETRSGLLPGRKNRIRYIAQIIVMLVCIFWVVLTVVRVSKERESWGGAIRSDDGLIMLSSSQYMSSKEAITGYGGVRMTYDLPVIRTANGYQYLAIWLVHSYIEIWSGDELIYECHEPSGPHVGHSPGCYWALVPLAEADRIEGLRLVVTPAYRQVANTAPVIYISSIRNIFNWRMRGEGTLLAISLLCVIEGIIFSLFTIIMRVPGKKGQSVFYMGLMITDLGLWKLCDLPSLSLIFPQANHVLSYASLIALMLIVPAITCFLSWRESRSGLYTIMCEGFLLFDIVLLVLHFNGISDLRENLALIQVALVLSLAVILERNIINIGRRLRDWQAWACIVLALSSLADFVIYYYVSNTLHLGITLTLMFFYGFANGVFVLRGVRIQNKLLREREMQLKEKQLALMMSQIRPHFLYNTLNTIYTLCKKDGDEAGRMILDLAGYLRINFENMDSIVPVPFKDELAHTRFYLSIEKRRFGDDIKVVYDIATESFALPALSLQPLVENAVKHGIRKTKDTGTVTIKTWEEQDGVHLMVEDDGGGFDTSTWEADIAAGAGDDPEEYAHRRSVGLRNVRDRIIDMCGGTMEIQSTIGEGTRVILVIPGHEPASLREGKERKVSRRRKSDNDSIRKQR
ncbi:MAG: histidine kinase [Lachnospiraceae bacterium]|nr:histidine kinase [Lachnospiraceae bacterium]